MTVDRQMILLRNYNLWSGLSDEEYDELNVVHNFIVAPKGDYIYFDSHLLNKLYFLKEGFIKIGYIDESGREVVKEIIQKGEVFGQFTLERNNMNGEFAQAYKTDVSLCAFNIHDFEKLIRDKPKLALQFTRQVGHQLRNVENRLVNLLNKNVKTRLINFIIMLAGTNGTEDSNAYHIQNFLTHEDIAQLIGSSRQTVTTLLNELEEAGFLKADRSAIIVHDVKAFKKLCDVV